MADFRSLDFFFSFGPDLMLYQKLPKELLLSENPWKFLLNWYIHQIFCPIAPSDSKFDISGPINHYFIIEAF